MDSGERQARYRANMEKAGFQYIGLWVPTAATGEFKLAADLIREQPTLTLGPLRDTRTGRLVPLK